ncbi:SecDF P1 head subdomain-containing protein [Pseudomonas vancouverensis]|uniref:SecDF P1 head subdomain domain-containing protein n=1 Tax=Pseudomonas vancouverensis TaxID=95300 RepID=A0A1H2P6T4_PSEVA|nr:hypothetical protein [Pseudomonas vancouverensis]KAB0500005.1 hypothetical protein F7R09_02200 [Pseudomonas vancouverensis]TDB68494.1 hypothetical protein EIY72_01170 [Pseudomonas vancouverensis]SDV13374.1 hypothetical protein SAMN05216558_3887 [Pseudomonas vancouverensis]
MKGSGKWLVAALGLAGALQCQAADIELSSTTDFIEMSLLLKRMNDLKPQSVELEVTLGSDAQQRFAQVTREALHQPLSLYINGVLVSTATIQTVVQGPNLRISIPRDVARHLLPTLLEQ